MLLGDAPKNETEVGSGSIEELMTLDVVLVIILLEAVAWQWGLEIQMRELRRPARFSCTPSCSTQDVSHPFNKACRVRHIFRYSNIHICYHH